jgi:hypothetical protein
VETSCDQPSAVLKPTTRTGFFVLTLKQIEDHGFEISRLDVGFAPCATIPAEIVDNEIHILIVAIRHDCGHPAEPMHNETPTQTRR